MLEEEIGALRCGFYCLGFAVLILAVGVMALGPGVGIPFSANIFFLGLTASLCSVVSILFARYS